eukprot:scaffold20052_cov191-Amphora_coffeaeformis.AAC.3
MSAAGKSGNDDEVSVGAKDAAAVPAAAAAAKDDTARGGEDRTGGMDYPRKEESFIDNKSIASRLDRFFLDKTKRTREDITTVLRLLSVSSSSKKNSSRAVARHMTRTGMVPVWYRYGTGTGTGVRRTVVVELGG